MSKVLRLGSPRADRGSPLAKCETGPIHTRSPAFVLARVFGACGVGVAPVADSGSRATRWPTQNDVGLAASE